jgi:hypothetical protein
MKEVKRIGQGSLEKSSMRGMVLEEEKVIEY